VTRLPLDRIGQLPLVPRHHVVRKLLQRRRNRVLAAERLQHDDRLVERLGAVHLELHPVHVSPVQRGGHDHDFRFADLRPQGLALDFLVTGRALVRRAGVAVEKVRGALEVFEDSMVILVVRPHVGDEKANRVLLRDAAHGASVLVPNRWSCVV
jgi:hypothetical protein